ncbi:MAG: helix-turn-helix domain-containing protein [Solobacterium sp.]|nr:helix-turn-helix domain-containing protein [Solobacterium sp.]
MKIEKNRHLIILNYLMKEREKYISSEYLAAKSMASVRSIKSDISYLNHCLEKENIAEIISKSSKGYQLMPIDEAVFEAFAQTLQVHQILFQNRSIEEMNRRLYIIQKLLVSANVKIDDLADALYLSRSSLTKDIARSTRFLRSFHIDVVSVPGKGLHLEGKEQDIRSAMVEVFCSQYHDIELLYPVEEFLNAFQTESYENVRHDMLKIIRESDLTISDIATKKIATYLCLIPFRKRFGKQITFEEETKRELKDSYEYRIAERIYHDEENEMINLARLLIINKDVNQRSSVSSHVPAEILHQARELFLRFTDTYTNSFFHSDIFKKHETDFESILIRLLLQNRFDHTDQNRLITYTETGENNDSPLASEYTRILTVFLEEQFHEKIRSADIKAFSALFHHLLKGIPVEYHKMRLAVFSMEGRTVAELMKEELTDMFSNYISTADVYNLYEMRRIDFQQYDAAISSWDVAYYRYPIPLVSYKGIHRSEDKEKLFHDLFIHGYEDTMVMHLEKLLQCHKEVKIHDYMTLIQSLSKQYSKDEAHEKRITEKIISRFSAVSYYNPDSGISMIFLDYEDTQKEILDIYIPSETVYWGTSMEIRYFIVVSLNPDNTLSDISVANMILHVLSRERKTVEQVMQDGNLKKLFLRLLYENLQ